MISGDFPVAQVTWPGAVRIIRSAFPPIDLFEDIADPADWPLLLLAEMKTNPRLMETIGNLDLVPPSRRVSGAGASWLMAPFTHVSRDRPSRFSDGSYGVLYAGESFETALFETIHHHGRFMARTGEAPGWTSQFRELVLAIDAALHDLRGERAGRARCWRRTIMRRARRSGRGCGLPGPMASSIRACAGRAGSASGCSGRTSPASRSRAGTSTITGTASGWISTARPGRGGCSESARRVAAADAIPKSSRWRLRHGQARLRNEPVAGRLCRP